MGSGVAPHVWSPADRVTEIRVRQTARGLQVALKSA
jgi:hypothetical protein